jgi:hypothetical protein
MRKSVVTLVLAGCIPLLSLGRGAEGVSSDKKKQPREGLAAGCAPATDLIYLEFNNVRTRVEAGGLWWQDRPNGSADYEVPIGSNSYALFAGGLWLGGTDVNGQLKAAASLFGNGVDYWTGPLRIDGTAEIDPTVCDQYNRFFEISRAEVAQFVAYKRAEAEGTAAEDFPDYQPPNSVMDWPGNGDESIGQSFRLAPYVNVAGDDSYEPGLGDYPFYDLVGDVDCRANRTDRSESSRRPLFGDKTYWWIFNDKGNLHTETNAPSIGMEIHGQAFAFATNDEVNDMTFYNFELINRSTFTLTDTYFASYVDPDLGNPSDDYVGCDVVRGLGYCYNGDENDEDFRGQNGYGTTPAVIGIDFFEGPYQDADGINNLVGIGEGEALNGLGYYDSTAITPDTTPDNERFGMRRFVYYNIGTANNGDPSLAVHYYNYMRGIWKNGQRMRHGGDGFTSAGVEQGVFTDFMFPGTSNPDNWGVVNAEGINITPANTNWTEDNPGGGQSRNDEGDRRFLQSAGPFTLEPGNVNDITVGVVFAKAASGGRLASVEKIFEADDKAQALFDNCFQVLNGPDAPDVTVQELNRELVFYLSNPETSNNREDIGKPYEEEDPDIVTPQYLLDRTPPVFYDNKYRFQGYQVYQLAGPGISIGDLEDEDKARLVFQTDIEDDVVTLVNYTFDEEIGASVPKKKVEGTNEGIRRSFSLTEDLFASGNSQLINFKTYYYIAIAYGFNEYKPYAQDVTPDETKPFAPASDGQKNPYISSRRSGTGAAIQPFTAIPHDPLFEKGGTSVNSRYGDEIAITRLQGQGNGGQALTLTQETIDSLFIYKNWESDTKLVGELDYTVGNGPFDVEIIDPLNVIDGTFYLQILDTSAASNNGQVVTNDAYWKLWLDGGGEKDTIYSSRSIRVENQQLLFDPNWGLSLTIKNGVNPESARAINNGFISATISYSVDDINDINSIGWLSGIQDDDSENPENWILAGTFEQASAGREEFLDRSDNSAGTRYIDPNEDFENILGGVISPYGLVRAIDQTNPITANPIAPAIPIVTPSSGNSSNLTKLNSILLVLTKDKTRWTRCPVVDTDETGGQFGRVKPNLSIDKDGNPVDTTGLGNLTPAQIDAMIATTTDENSAAYISAFGMGWFPGYAIDKETGKRLNMAYGEDKKYGTNNGNDMIWNPTSTRFLGQNGGFVSRVWGGKHYMYIFRELLDSEKGSYPPTYHMPEYDAGAIAKTTLSHSSNTVRSRFGYSTCNWVGVPLLAPGATLLSADVAININVSKPFGIEESYLRPSLENEGRPVYRFNTEGVRVVKQQSNVLKDALDRIGVVPNPYYAISEYETTQLDNTVKFINLPEQCVITIYNTNGTLIRRYNKTSPLNFLDWDLSNQVGIPISSGVYIIHVEVPGVGEKIMKWFGVIRPVDLNNF